MARIGIDKPPLTHLEPTGDRVEPLHEGSGGRYEVAPLMAPIRITMWAHTLLHHGERFKAVVECW
jgi:hypothetical protein